MKAIFDSVGEKKSCLTLSNIGQVKVPEIMARYIERFDFILDVQAAAPYNCGMLSYGDNNERSLIRKLTARGIARERAEAVAREMSSLGYINEQRQLLNIVSKEANVNLSGPRRIRAKLISRGYRTADISSAIDELVRCGEVDFERSAELLISKKLTRDATDDEKKALLYKNGYNIC